MGIFGFMGCASLNSGSGPNVLAQVREHGMTGSVRVVVDDTDHKMFCALPDASNEIRCTVGMGYLYKNVHSDWSFLNAQDARQICYEGMWSIAYSTGYGREEVQLCAYALLQIRFIHLPPDPRPEEWQ